MRPQGFNRRFRVLRFDAEQNDVEAVGKLCRQTGRYGRAKGSDRTAQLKSPALHGGYMRLVAVYQSHFVLRPRQMGADAAADCTGTVDEQLHQFSR